MQSDRLFEIRALAFLILIFFLHPACSDPSQPPVLIGVPPEPISSAFLQSQGFAFNANTNGPEAIVSMKSTGPIKAFFLILLGVYRHGITPADGPSCSFQPTCSGYSRDAVHRHGVVEGILMTGDRLRRCNGYDKSAYPMVGPERHYFDPVP